MYSDSSSNVRYQGLSNANAIKLFIYTSMMPRKFGMEFAKVIFSSKDDGFHDFFWSCRLSHVPTTWNIYTLVQNMTPNRQDFGTIWRHGTKSEKEREGWRGKKRWRKDRWRKENEKMSSSSEIDYLEHKTNKSFEGSRWFWQRSENGWWFQKGA